VVLVNVLRPGAGPGPAAVAVAASLVPAHLSYRWVENPIRRSRSLAAAPRRTTLLGLAAIGASMATLLALSAWTGHRATSGTSGTYRAAAHDIHPAFEDGCVAGFPAVAAKPSARCTYGDPDGSKTIALVGDSHAAQWVPALDRIGRRTSTRVILFAKSSCPVADVVVDVKAYRRRYRECEAFRDDAARRIRELRPDHVILTSFSAYVVVQGIAPDAWEHGMAATIRTMQRSGAPVTVLHDVPTASESVPGCLEHRAAIVRLGSGDCGFPRDRPVARSVVAAERRAAEATGARTVDVSRGVCPEPRCRALVDGVVTYFDGSHITATYSRRLAPWLERHLAFG
jgi:hypothetical protein